MKTIFINTLRFGLLTLIAVASTTIFSGCASESKSYDRSYTQPTPAYQPYRPAPRDPKSF